MATAADKNPPIPLGNSHRLLFATQVSLRALATASTLAASAITLTNSQHKVLYGFLPMDAKYSYSPAFKFFGYANMAVCILSAFSLSAACIMARRKAAANPKRFFYLFLHDLMMETLLMAACAAATAVGYIGKYGNSHAGWMPICDNFGRYCKRATIASALSYIGLIAYASLTVVSAAASRRTTV